VRAVSEPLVRIVNLTRTFHHLGRPLEVLRGIDLEIREADFVAIVGPSGAGKSTLLHCIGTLDLPTSGQIFIGGQDITRLSSQRLAALRNRNIGFVFQFHHLLPEFTALENVQMPGLIQGMGRSESEPRARRLLEEVGLGGRATHRPGELAGGEQQRGALARALLLEPPILRAEEPTGKLDSATSESIHDLFFSINKNRGTTIVVVTHNTAFADRMPRTVRMRDGKVEQDLHRSTGREQAQAD